MRFFFIALQFLTIIPLPFSVRCEEKDLGSSLSFFPLAGLTLGALLVGSNYLLTPYCRAGLSIFSSSSPWRSLPGYCIWTVWPMSATDWPPAAAGNVFWR